MEIVIQRGKQVKLEELPEYSIALDGFCNDGPKLDPGHHRFNLDHHNNCSRFATNATCMQAFLAVNLGLDPSEYTIYINDTDLDVCLSYWILKNYEKCKEPLVKKLVDAVNLCDSFLGAIPVNGMSKIINYISAPEVDSKKNDDYSKLSDDGLKNILEATMHRIDEFVDSEINNSDLEPPRHGEFKIIRDENDWVLIESGDSHITSHLYAIGYDRIVRYHRQKDNSIEVTIAKKSDFITNFPIEKFGEALNEIEPQELNGEKCYWGGGTSVHGSPRRPDGSRSKLPIEKIIEVIDNLIK